MVFINQGEIFNSVNVLGTRNDWYLICLYFNRTPHDPYVTVSCIKSVFKQRAVECSFITIILKYMYIKIIAKLVAFKSAVHLKIELDRSLYVKPILPAIKISLCFGILFWACIGMLVFDKVEKCLIHFVMFKVLLCFGQ